MKDGICPKCEAREVRVFKNTAPELSINVGMFSAAGLIYHVCTNCGYVELFVKDKEKLPRIADQYPRI